MYFLAHWRYNLITFLRSLEISNMDFDRITWVAILFAWIELMNYQKNNFRINLLSINHLLSIFNFYILRPPCFKRKGGIPKKRMVLAVLLHEYSINYSSKNPLYYFLSFYIFFAREDYQNFKNIAKDILLTLKLDGGFKSNIHL